MGEMSQRVFISHASEDTERFVLGFARKLLARGVDAWVDRWEILPGHSLVDKVFDGIASAKAIVVVLSKHSVDKPWVREELNAAFVRRVSNRCRLIPVVIDDCEVPVALESTVWERIHDLNHYESEFERILHAIYGRSMRPGIGPEDILIRRQKLRDAFNVDLGEPISVSEDDYDVKELEALILDRDEASQVRRRAIEFSVSSGSCSADLVRQLVSDPSFGVRRTVLQAVRRSPDNRLREAFDIARVTRLLNDPNLDVCLEAIRLTCDLARLGLIPIEQLTVVNHHDHWHVRRNAIQGLINSGSSKTIELLYEFRTTSYHVSQQLMRDYISSHWRDFDGRERDLALALLDGLIHAKHASAPSKEKAQKLIDTLRGEVPEPLS
ncbi:MAG TPA: toll/interleukin-1 receptor domain-containing protein [Symbiobacteriaceae bacterium]|nr:toll/interleukin-1 receptor domain-containing protein [Symbiobacteriaceae bacterium]